MHVTILNVKVHRGKKGACRAIVCYFYLRAIAAQCALYNVSGADQQCAVWFFFFPFFPFLNDKVDTKNANVDKQKLD